MALYSGWTLLTLIPAWVRHDWVYLSLTCLAILQSNHPPSWPLHCLFLSLPPPRHCDGHDVATTCRGPSLPLRLAPQGNQLHGAGHGGHGLHSEKLLQGLPSCEATVNIQCRENSQSFTLTHSHALTASRGGALQVCHALDHEADSDQVL